MRGSLPAILAEFLLCCVFLQTTQSGATRLRFDPDQLYNEVVEASHQKAESAISPLWAMKPKTPLAPMGSAGSAMGSTGSMMVGSGSSVMAGSCAGSGSCVHQGSVAVGSSVTGSSVGSGSSIVGGSVVGSGATMPVASPAR